jgi:hypothetical protein
MRTPITANTNSTTGLRDFDTIPVSTQTIVATSNLVMDIDRIFQSIEIREPILVVYYQDRIRGDPPQPKKKTTTGTPKYFRNALNVMVRTEDHKNINFKVSKNGKLQFTGCKHYHHAVSAFRVLFCAIMESCPDALRRTGDTAVPGYTLVSPSLPIELCFYTVMTNIDFDIGFLINRQNLDDLINQETPLGSNSLLETSFGYTGVNIKIPITETGDVPVPRLRIRGYDAATRTVISDIDTVLMPPYITEKKKTRYNTFLVFYSGVIIMSGPNPDAMRDVFYRFVRVLSEWRTRIEETY